MYRARRNRLAAIAAMLTSLLVISCSGVKQVKNEPGSGYVFVDDAEQGQPFMSSNADGAWSVMVSVDAGNEAVNGTVTFTGPAEKTRKMGMCLVQRFDANPGGAICDSVDDCAAAPALLSSGGARYCVPEEIGGPSYCHYRPGPPGEYCAGSPALALAEISPGTYRVTVAASSGTQWLAMACFEACVHLPHAISRAATVR